MGYEVKITSRANWDLIEILEHIESRENDSRPAIQFANALVEEALSLGELPYGGRTNESPEKDPQVGVPKLSYSF